MSGPKVVVDRQLCAGYANCIGAAPDVFDLDKSDIAVVIDAADLSAHRDLIERAIRVCPAKAITLVD